MLLQQEITCDDWRVLRGLAFICQKNRDFRIPIHVVEERNTLSASAEKIGCPFLVILCHLSVRFFGEIPLLDHNSMKSRKPLVVGPAAHQITQVDDERVGDEGHIMPYRRIKVFGNLESGSISSEDSDCAVVSVC